VNGSSENSVHDVVMNSVQSDINRLLILIFTVEKETIISFIINSTLSSKVVPAHSKIVNGHPKLKFK
jgi:hypothetical protein